MPYAPLAHGVRLHYSDVGDPRRPTVLLLGPAGADASAWTFQVDELAARYRTIAVDHRASGLTEYSAKRFRIDDLAADACRLLDHLRVDCVAAIGVAMGGCVALSLAIRRPHRLWGLVLASTSPGGRLASRSHGQRLDMIRAATSLPPGERGRRLAELYYGPRALATNPEAYEAIIARAHWDADREIDPDAHPQNRAISAFNVARRVGRIDTPALVLHGDDDPLIPLSDAAQLAEALPGARFEVLPGGHLFFMQSADRFNRRVLDFLAEHAVQPADAAS
jgi:3-oxoadipate enol-lactonase